MTTPGRRVIPRTQRRQPPLKLTDPIAQTDREPTFLATDIWDRQMMVRSLEVVLAERRSPGHAALFMVGLDPESVINDSLRRGTGNRLVEIVEMRLLDLFGIENDVARVGEDEFAVFIDDLHGIDEAERIAKRLIRTIGQPVGSAHESLIPVVSVGVALISGAHGNASDVIRDAKAAMHLARQERAAGYQVMDQMHRQRLVERSTMQRNIVHALEHDEFVLYYQPIITLDGGRTTAIEALLRWDHPTQGITAPGPIIAAAEESQLITRIGEWALRTAAKQAAQWWNDSTFECAPVVHVNVSPRQLLRSAIVQTVERALAESNTPPEAICLEIIESFAIEEAALPVLNALKDLGVGLSIDDFGTGYSSLKRLASLPVDSIKLDRCFVQDVAESKKSKAIPKAVSAIGKALDLTLIAEGIETPYQLDRMANLGYQHGQGFLMCRPQPADYFENEVARAAPNDTTG